MMLSDRSCQSYNTIDRTAYFLSSVVRGPSLTITSVYRKIVAKMPIANAVTWDPTEKSDQIFKTIFDHLDASVDGVIFFSEQGGQDRFYLNSRGCFGDSCEQVVTASLADYYRRPDICHDRPRVSQECR